MKCEHIRLAHCVAKTGQVWILCNSIDQYIGPLRLVNHTRHYSVSHAWKIWSHIWSRGGCTSTLKLPWPLYGQHCWCAISIRMASVLTLLTKLIYWCFSLFFVFTGTLRWFNIWGTCVCECRPMATCKIFATASDFHLQIHGQSTYNLRMPPRKLDWIFASRVGQSQVAVEASLVIFHLSTHLWHIPHASSQVWRHSRRSVVSDRHGHSHDFQGMKLSLRHSLRNTLQTDNFYFFQDCNGSHEIKYKKINVSHIPRSSRTLTSLNNTCPCTCVSERKKNCVCVLVCTCVVSTLSSWEAFLEVYCFQTFAYVHVLQCALIRCRHGYHPLASLEAGGRWIQHCSSFWRCTWKQHILNLWRCVYSMLYFCCSFFFRWRHNIEAIPREFI